MRHLASGYRKRTHVARPSFAWRRRCPPAVHERRRFFDLDNTLIRGSSLYQLGLGLHARGLVSTMDIVRLGRRHLGHALGRGEQKRNIVAATDGSGAVARGLHHSVLHAEVELIVRERIMPRVRPAVLAAAREHQASGQQVWLVTASVQPLAETLARQLRLTGAMGSKVVVVDGFYTGEQDGPLLHGRQKAEAVLRLAAAEGFDLSASSAYSDSVNDLPMLRVVGHPRPVCPDRRLRKYASRHGWRVFSDEH
ncbi:HAD family hydrolase [Streptacidiphilus sp. 4-A2]|nr:HAD family hydrolase [Streptacidiphilus sp. 4-A2]